MLNRDLRERNQMAEELRLLNETLEARVSDRTKELENANRLKDEFLSVISFELWKQASRCILLSQLNRLNL